MVCAIQDSSKALFVKLAFFFPCFFPELEVWVACVLDDGGEKDRKHGKQSCMCCLNLFFLLKKNTRNGVAAGRYLRFESLC